MVIRSTGPTDAAVIIGQAIARGFKGKFLGTSPTWNPGLLKGPAGSAIMSQYLQSGPVAPFGANTPGHEAMRAALGNVPQPNEGHTSGWVLSYPLKAALEKATENKDLTRAGLLAAVKSLTSVDYEGMLPEGAGNYSADPDEAVVRQIEVHSPMRQRVGGQRARAVLHRPDREGLHVREALLPMSADHYAIVVD